MVLLQSTPTPSFWWARKRSTKPAAACTTSCWADDSRVLSGERAPDIRGGGSRAEDTSAPGWAHTSADRRSGRDRRRDDAVPPVDVDRGPPSGRRDSRAD